MEQTVLFLGQLLDCSAGISFNCINYTKDDIAEFLKGSTNHLLDQIGRKNIGIFQPQAEDNTFCMHWIFGTIVFLLYGNKDANVVYIWGPVLTKPFLREDLLPLLENAGILQQAAASVLHYCDSLPVVSERKLQRIGELVIQHLATRKNQSGTVLSTAGIQFFHQPGPTEEIITQMRQVEIRYEHSAALTDAIKQGNLSLALHMISRYSPGEQTPVRNANPLRNAQNYCIVLNTQLRHALEETGIHPYQIDTLSNEIGLEIEQIKSVSQMPGFFSNVIRRYCRLVQEHSYPNLKPLVNMAVTYIKEHLADNLTVKDTAKALTVNANYLSTLFHSEMGMTFIDFVNMERTKQAAALLTHTNLQVQQIASIVGYNNTSYFAKQFVRFQGVSPSQYRRG